MKCDRCGADNPDHLTFCRDCGNRLQSMAGGAPIAPHGQGDQWATGPTRPVAPDFDFAPKSQGASEHACARCGSANTPSNRFCVSCGAALPPVASAPAPVPAASTAPVSCGRCQGTNPGGTRFCQFCGAPLQPEGTLAAAQPVHASQQVQPGYPAAPPPQPTRQAVPDGSAGAQYAAQSPLGRARLVVITQDGSAGRDYSLTEDQADIGRDEGSIRLPNDPYVSPRHARIHRRNGAFFIRDLASVNGIYVRLRGQRKLAHGDLVLVGLEVLRFEFVSDAERHLGAAVERGTQVFGSPATTRHARLCQRTVEGITRDVYSIIRDETIVGRESGDIVFTGDPFMSRQHAVLTRDPADNSFTLRDLGSSNGTYVAIRDEIQLHHGDHVRIGQHLFRLEAEPA